MEAAADWFNHWIKRINVSTHSRVEAAAELMQYNHQLDLVSTHSRVEAAARWLKIIINN